MGESFNFKLIVNPVAGNKKAKKLLPKINDIFKKSDCFYDIYITKGPGDAINAAREAANNGADIVVAVGGDGTVNEVANGLAGTEASLAALPAGTGNDFVRAMKIPNSIEKACKILIKGKSRYIDLGKVNGRYFVNLVGVGFDGAVARLANQQNKRVGGPWVYFFSILKNVISYKPVEMKITMDNRTMICTPTLVAVGIGQYYGGGIKIVPEAIQNDGLFDVCIVDKIGRLKLISYLPLVYFGEHTNLKDVSIFRTEELKLEMEIPLTAQMEGEIISSKKMHFTLEHKGLKAITG